jgi:threonyl-tRNA synthetase
MPLSENEYEICKKIQEVFMNRGVRANIDESQGSLSKRVLFAHRPRPFSKLIVGPKEIESEKLNLELRNKKERGDLAHVIQVLKEICAAPV